MNERLKTCGPLVVLTRSGKLLATFLALERSIRDVDF